MSHTIYAANEKVSHIHQRMCEWDYTIDKSLVCLQAKEEVMLECIIFSKGSEFEYILLEYLDKNYIPLNVIVLKEEFEDT